MEHWCWNFKSEEVISNKTGFIHHEHCVLTIILIVHLFAATSLENSFKSFCDFKDSSATPNSIVSYAVRIEVWMWKHRSFTCIKQGYGMTFHYWFIISLSLDSSVFLQPWSVHSNYSYSVVIYLQSGNNCIIFITQMMAPVTGKCISPSLRKLWKNTNKSIYVSILPLWHLYRNCGLCYMHQCSSFVNMVKYARLKGNMPLNFLSKMWSDILGIIMCDVIIGNGIHTFWDLFDFVFKRTNPHVAVI